MKPNDPNRAQYRADQESLADAYLEKHRVPGETLESFLEARADKLIAHEGANEILCMAFGRIQEGNVRTPRNYFSARVTFALRRQLGRGILLEPPLGIRRKLADFIRENYYLEGTKIVRCVKIAARPYSVKTFDEILQAKIETTFNTNPSTAHVPPMFGEPERIKGVINTDFDELFRRIELTKRQAVSGEPIQISVNLDFGNFVRDMLEKSDDFIAAHGPQDLHPYQLKAIDHALVNPQSTLWLDIKFSYTKTTQKETKTMINIKKVTYINEMDIKDLSEGQLFNMIAEEEKTIQRLEAIEAKPKKLVADIKKRKADIAELIVLIDAK